MVVHAADVERPVGLVTQGVPIMKERDLANLLIQMGVDSGLDIERAADQLATMQFPSFVDNRAYRAALLDAVEAQMRMQMEQRLQAMRQKFDVAASYSPPAAAATFQPTTPAYAAPVTPIPTPASNLHGMSIEQAGTVDTIIGNIGDDDEGTSDDTIVWSPRRD
jgi:hypothetical protein